MKNIGIIAIYFLGSDVLLKEKQIFSLFSFLLFFFPMV